MLYVKYISSAGSRSALKAQNATAHFSFLSAGTERSGAMDACCVVVAVVDVVGVVLVEEPEVVFVDVPELALPVVF